MINELWHPINEAPMFTISNCGRVQYLLTGELMKEYIDPDEGYIGVWLIGEDSKTFFAPIDALVVEAFLGPIDGMEEIIHKDGDPWNNEVWNLDVDDSYWLHRTACDDCE